MRDKNGWPWPTKGLARKRDKNGWRAGTDPTQHWLRVGATLVVIGLIVFMVVTEAAFSNLFIVFGALMVLLGFAGALKLPGIVERRDRDGDD